LGALGSGAFGGLGSPSLGPPPSRYGGGLTSNHHDPWSRLHSGPPGFPGPSWAKGSDKRDERERGKDSERRDIPHIKDEKDRYDLFCDISNEPTHSQRESNPSSSSAGSTSVTTWSQSKKSDRTTTPVSKSLLVPPVKVKEERKEEPEVAAVAAAAAAPHHPPTSTSTSNPAVRQEFSLMAHHFDRPPQLGPPGGGLMDEEQRAQILREDFERARYFGIPSHAATAAHLEQLHPGLYSRLGHLNPHMPNGILAKTPAGLVGALSMGGPPPLIPSIASRSSTPPRRLGVPGELALYSAHKDGESR
uniref:Fibrosin n=1 Tax=Neogobius melanostomus TaxID=47308 RepID=A0A8C6TS70_9GOBI